MERGKEIVGEGWGPSTPGRTESSLPSPNHAPATAPHSRDHPRHPPHCGPLYPPVSTLPASRFLHHDCTPSFSVFPILTPVPFPLPHLPPTPQRVRRTYLGCSCSASPGAPPPRRPPASSLSLVRLSVPAALTYRAHPGAAGPGGGYVLPVGVWRPEEGKREKKREKVCHRLGGAGEGNAKPDRK